MDEQPNDWFCAHFETPPDLDVLNEYRKLTGPTICMFIVHVGGGSALHADLYLPPDAARLVKKISADPQLPAFKSCPRPDDARIKLLFGDESDLRRYFPARSV